MVASTKFRLKARDRDTYLDLVKEFPLVSIKTDEHLKAAQQFMDQLLSGDTLDSGEELYLEALSDLVAAYEDVHHKIGPASDADMLRHLIESRALTQADVSRATGVSKSSISDVLSGRRPLSRKMIRTMSKFFLVDVSVLASNL